MTVRSFLLYFFFNDTATTEIYTLSLHDALPISWCRATARPRFRYRTWPGWTGTWRSEEHTSELQSRGHLVCRLLLEKKKNVMTTVLCLPTKGRDADPPGRVSHSVSTRLRASSCI